MKPKSGRWHTVYSIISTILEEAGIAVLMMVVLPVFGISIPLWGIVAVLVAFAVFSYITYRIGHPTVLYDGITDPNSIVGKEGIVEVDLNPAGYVRVEGELWKAAAAGGGLRKGDVVVITGINGLELTVGKKVDG